MVKVIFFDVANTLMYKPELFSRIQTVLENHELTCDLITLKERHKWLSELITFPDKTSKEFYTHFNGELLYSLGIIPYPQLLEDIFSACTYLDWCPFEDTHVLNKIEKPIGIISNWDSTLSEKIARNFSVKFSWMLNSQLQGLRKPDKSFFKMMIKASAVDPKEILYIGDSIKLDIEPALQLGVSAVLVDRDDIYAQSRLARVSSLDQILSLI